MINVNELDTKTIRELSHGDLMKDALEKRNVTAVKWLVEASNRTTTKEKNGKMVEREVPVASYVYDYLTTYCGYEHKKEKKLSRKEINANALAEIEKMLAEDAELEKKKAEMEGKQ